MSADPSQLVDILAGAFPSQPLEIAATADAEHEDGPDGARWRDYVHAAAFAAHVRGKPWDTLEPEFLEQHHDVLAYLTPNAFAALLPAYLMALIRDEDVLTVLPWDLLQSLTRDRYVPGYPARFDARVDRLTEQQRTAVAHVLEALAEVRGEAFYQGAITAALDRYWRYLPVVSLDDLVHEVAGAFPRRSLSDPALFTWSSEPGAGGWGGYLHAREFETHLEARTWDMLEPEFLEQHHDALAYLGPDAFAAVLPAYLVAYIRHGETLDMLPEFLLSTLTRTTGTSSHPDIFDVRAARLTARQRAAVTRVLEGLTRSPMHLDLQPMIVEALDSDWRDVPRQPPNLSIN